MPRLRVRLHLDKVLKKDIGSTVRCAVMDTSEADALHEAVAEAVVEVKDHKKHIDMEIKVPKGAMDRKRHYSLWCHVDHTGEGQIRSGDLITTQSIPVTLSDLEADSPVIDAALTRI